VATAVYLLCTIAASACAWLLARSYARTRLRLLLWSTLCFLGLALHNGVLFVDKVIATDVDLSAWRLLPAAVGFAALVYGLVWEAD
jgi:Family of unknown function (DUF5985)